MADIDVEKKKPVWPWIVAAVVIAIILLIIFIDNNAEEPPLQSDPISIIEPAPAHEINTEIPVIA